MGIFSKIKLLVGAPGHEEPADEFHGGIPQGSLRAAVADHGRRTWADSFKPRQRWAVSKDEEYLRGLGRVPR